MAGSLYDANNVVVGHAVLWLHPWVPGVAPEALVPDDTPLFDFAIWELAGWTGAGATNEGFKINVEASTTTVTIEEQSIPVDETLEGKNISIEAALAEDTLESMSLSWSGGVITAVAATPTTPGTRKMNLTNEIKKYTACLEMRNFKGLARRIYIEKMSVSGAGEVTFRRAAEKHTYPVKMVSLCAPEKIQIVDIVAPKTA